MIFRGEIVSHLVYLVQGEDILTAISKPCPPFTAVCEETSTVTRDFFSQVFAKKSLIKNIFEEEKKFDGRT